MVQKLAETRFDFNWCSRTGKTTVLSKTVDALKARGVGLGGMISHEIDKTMRGGIFAIAA